MDTNNMGFCYGMGKPLSKDWFSRDNYGVSVFLGKWSVRAGDLVLGLEEGSSERTVKTLGSEERGARKGTTGRG